MSRKYYGHRKSYRRNNIISLTGRNGILTLGRNEKQILRILYRIIKGLINATIEIFKFSYDTIKRMPVFLKSYTKAYKNGYDLNELLIKFKHLTPREFEILISELFITQGYDTELTKFVHDYGRDVILKRKVNGRTEVTYVECKYYSPNNTIGRDIAFKLLGSMQMFNADKGIIISTGKFHKNSIEVAETVNNLKLMDTLDIEQMLFKLNANQIQRVMFRLENVV